MMDRYYETDSSQDVMEGLMKKVDGYITLFSSCPSKNPKISQVIAHASQSRGKMLRPRMLLLSAQCGPAFEVRGDVLCKLAAVVEMTHMASLIHDDIVDDADQRHGIPSVQRKYGKKAAVYAGDFLMSQMIEQTCKNDMVQAASVLARTMGRMCLGEIGQSFCLFREDMKISEYLENIYGKTAALFMAACRIGAEESGCDPKVTAQLESFGECFGLAFQLRDDLMDFVSDENRMGKDVHKDFREGIYTYPLLYVLNKRDVQKKLQPILKANAQGSLSAEQLKEMETIVVQEHGIDAARAQLKTYVDRAEKIIHAFGPEQKAAGQLLALMKYLEGE